MTNELYYRMATTEAGLAKGYLFAIGIPPPQLIEYQEYTERFPRSTGAESRHGYKYVVFIWEVLDNRQAGFLREIVDAAGDTLYATFDRKNAEAVGPDWIDAYGSPLMPTFNPESPAHGRGTTFRNVRLEIKNLTIVNDPASF